MVTTMTDDPVRVTGGVDTHKHVHVAAALDGRGGVLGVREFPATGAGHVDLRGWLGSFGTVDAVGVEGTGSWGAGLCRSLREAQVTVVTTYNVTAGSAQAALVAALRGAGAKVVVVALRNPYDIAHFPEVEAYLASFAWSREAMRAVADVLVGRTSPAGRLPVAVPTADGTATLYPYGAGIGL